MRAGPNKKKPWFWRGSSCPKVPDHQAQSSQCPQHPSSRPSNRFGYCYEQKTCAGSRTKGHLPLGYFANKENCHTE